MRKHQFFTSFIIYLDRYNFSEELLQSFLSFTDSNFEYREIILINESDRHQEDRNVFLKNFVKQDKSIMLFNAHKFYGRSESMADATSKTIGDIVFYIDYPYNTIFDRIKKEAIDHINQGYDVVNFRYKKTHLISALTRRSINKITNTHKKISSRNFIYRNSGLKYKVIDIKDKLSLKLESVVHRYFNKLNTAALYTRIPVFMALFCALFFMFFLVAVLAYTTIVYFNYSPIPGWTSMMLVMTSSFTALFLLLFVILNYLSLITQELIYKNNDYQVKYEVTND